MTEQTSVPVVHSTVDILKEALSTIKATYWIQSHEFTFADPLEVPEKFITVQADNCESYENEVKDGVLHVVGMCSIGAIALADHTLYNNAFRVYSSIIERSQEARMAGAYLATAIRVKKWIPAGEMADTGETITDWNDLVGTTREEVIEMFNQAIKDASEQKATYWRVDSASNDLDFDSCDVVFSTKVKAEAYCRYLNEGCAYADCYVEEVS